MSHVVVVPTYQEAENVVRFLTAVRREMPDAEVIVVDDSSPDGTGELAEKAGADLGGVTVLHRPGKQGLGAAYRAGFARALSDGHDVVVQMDCDFSHDPASIRDLVARVEAGADCVIGSRYVPGGSTPNWPWRRRVLSRYGNMYTSKVLRLGIGDATSGFRAYRASTLEAIDVASSKSSGYVFMSELAERMVRSGLRIEEVPITFMDRTAGTSKMSGRIIVESMLRVTLSALRPYDKR